MLPIEPEKINAYEIGFKTAGSAVRFDAAAFYYDYSNLHVGVTVPNPITGIGVISTIINAKAAEVYGAEAQLSVEPVDNLNLSAGVTYVHARYTDFRNATATGFNAATGRNATNQLQDWTGKQMARAPELTATAQASYSFAALGGTASFPPTPATARHTSSTTRRCGGRRGPALANVQRYRQGAYAIVNLRAGWTDPSDRFTLTGFVNNVTNTRFQLVTSGGGLRRLSPVQSADLCRRGSGGAVLIV